MSSEQRLVYIITGGNAGIGKEVARQLVEKGLHVILACRNNEACEAACSELMHSSGSQGGSCECGPQLDLEDFSSVRRYAAEQRSQLQTRGETLSCLINNAGVMGVPSDASGTDRHLVINHLGPYLLSRLLAPALMPGSRIVNVASRAHYAGALSIQDGAIVNAPKTWWSQYARSKLCNVLMADELSRRLSARGVTSYGVSPGLVNSTIFRNVPWLLRWTLAPLQPLFFRTPQQGATSVVYAATAPELTGRSVPFIHDCKPLQPSALARDKQLAGLLWDASARMVGLDAAPNDPHYL